MAKDRFKVRENTPNSFGVIDNEYHLLEDKLAVVIYFKYKSDADKVCELMNREWNRFKVNPN